MINSHSWSMPREAIHVMHFTLGPIKPWHWWASWVAAESAAWQAVRSQVHCRDAALVRYQTCVVCACSFFCISLFLIQIEPSAALVRSHSRPLMQCMKLSWVAVVALVEGPNMHT